MKKNDLVRVLKRVDDNPEIGIKVLHADGSTEFWGFEAKNFIRWNGGRGLACLVVRQEDPLTDEDFKRLKVKPVDSVKCTLEQICERLEARYTMPEWDIKDKKDLPSRRDMVRMVMYIILRDLQELIRVKDDYIEIVREVFPEFEMYRGVDINANLEIQK